MPHARGVPAPLGHCKKDLGILLLPPGMDSPGDDLGRGRQCSVLLDHCSQVGSQLCYCSSVNQHPPRAARGLTLEGASSRILRHPPAAPRGAAAQPGLQQLLSRDLGRFERVDSSPSPLQSSGIWYHPRGAQHQPCGRHRVAAEWDPASAQLHLDLPHSWQGHPHATLLCAGVPLCLTNISKCQHCRWHVCVQHMGFLRAPHTAPQAPAASTRSLEWLCGDTWFWPHVWGPHFLLLLFLPLLQTCLVPTLRLGASHSTQDVWILISGNKLSLFPKNQWATSVSPEASLCPWAAQAGRVGRCSTKAEHTPSHVICGY